MTSREYQKFADALKATMPPVLATAARLQWLEDLQVIADVCANDNSRFDRNRFLAACGMDVTANT